MKKPLVSLKSRSDTAKFVLSLLLTASAFMLFFLPEDSVSVFGGEDVKSQFTGIISLIQSYLT